MTPELAGLIGILAGFVLAALVILYFHERREFRKQDLHEAAAEAREVRAKARHDLQMKALNDARALTLAAIDQRSRLDTRVQALELATNDHAAHLESLGRVGPVKV